MEHELIGQVFGDLKVIGAHRRKTETRSEILLDCVCTLCGEPAIRRRGQLLGQQYGRPSCKPCHNLRLAELNYKGTEHIPSQRVSLIKHNAIHRNINFDLTQEDLEDIYQQQEGKCYYTGRELSKETWSPDRIDSSLGYTKDNVVLCLWDVNRMKTNYSIEEFVNLCKLVAENARVS